jgi:hypothetical protein
VRFFDQEFIEKSGFYPAVVGAIHELPYGEIITALPSQPK